MVALTPRRRTSLYRVGVRMHSLAYRRSKARCLAAEMAFPKQNESRVRECLQNHLASAGRPSCGVSVIGRTVVLRASARISFGEDTLLV